MKNFECKKIEAMLNGYIEHKLSDEERTFVENHFVTCPECYQKYLEMKSIIGNLHFEYARLIREFEQIEQNKNSDVQEYASFFQNISPYIDDELGYDDSIKFRKYLLKSKPARQKLANAYALKNNIKNSVFDYKNKLNINFSKQIMKELKNKTPSSFDVMYKKAAIFIGFLISTLVMAAIYMGFHYISEYFDKPNTAPKMVQKIDMPNEDEMVEFTFDMGKSPLLISK